MMETEGNIHCLGINFRSDEHLGWFLISMMTFFIMSLSIVYTLFIGEKVQVKIILGCLEFVIGGHLGTAIIAVFKTRCGRINGKTYSKDCIWFNALLGIIYLLSYGLIRFSLKI